MTQTVDPDDLPEIVELVLKALAQRQAGQAGHPFGDAVIGAAAQPVEWARWAESLPVYGLALAARQNADGSLPYSLNVGGLGISPLA